MRGFFAFVVLCCAFALSKASALKSNSQELQYHCQVDTIETLYEEIMSGTYDLRQNVYANVQAALNGSLNCLSYFYNPETVWNCAVNVVEDEINNTVADLEDYLSNTKTLCDQLTQEIKSCITL